MRQAGMMGATVSLGGVTCLCRTVGNVKAVLFNMAWVKINFCFNLSN